MREGSTIVGLLIVLTVFSIASAQKIEKISVNGLSLTYLEKGSGPLVILIHGSVSDYREWSEQIGPLAQHYRVVAYSRRFHWPNPAPGNDADVSIERQADDLAEIVKRLGSRSAHIVGHSFGGAVALNFALRYPKLVRTLVLAEPAASGVLADSPENKEAIKEGQAIRTRMGEVFDSGDAERIVRAYADHVAPGEFEKATTDVREMLIANVHAFQLDYTSRRPVFSCDDARRVAVPVLVLSGSRSPFGLQRIAAATANCIAKARLITIPGATHWMQHDHAQEFNAAVLGFLAGSRR
jgi:pimeloyl-ACP methyl ester carboxylesterase